MLGVLFMCLSTIGAVTGNVITLHLIQSGTFPGIMNIFLARGLCLLLVQFVLSRYFGSNLLDDLKSADPKLMALRVLIPIVAYSAQLNSLNFIPVTIFTVIFSTNPFITTIIASCTLGTKVSRVEIVAMVICFACVMLIVATKNDSSSVSEQASVFGPVIGMALAFAPTTAYSVNGLLAFKMRPLHFSVQLFYVALGLVLVPCVYSLGQLLIQGSTDLLSIDYSQLGFLAVIGVGMCFENLF